MDTQRARHIAAVTERLGRLLGNDAHASNLLPVQWEALRYLDRANRFSKSSSALTAYLGLTKGTVSQTIKALEAKGLVSNRVNPKDRRRNQLELTSKGSKLLAKDPIEKMIEAIAALPEPAIHSLDSGLEQLLSSRLDIQNRQPFGQCRDCVYFAQDHAEGDPFFCMLLNEKLSEDDSKSICSEQIARC